MFNGLKKRFSHWNITGQNQLIVGALFLIIYLFLEPFLHSKLSEFWVTPVASLFQGGVFFDTIFCCLSAVFIWIYRNRKLNAFDWLLICFYFNIRFINTDWIFKSVFGEQYGSPFQLWYVDFIGIYYVTVGLIQLRHYLLLKNLEETGPTMEKDVLYTDMPLNVMAKRAGRSVADLDAEGLNRGKFAAEIAGIMQRMRPYLAFAIGICGPWGSGKSSLISLITERLKEQEKGSDGTNRTYEFIEFVPWFFSGSEALITSFLGRVEQVFKDDSTLAEEIRKYSRILSITEKKLLDTEYTSLLSDEHRDLKKRHDEITERIRKKNKILIVTIDDLDRLDQTEVVDVFRLIRLVANFPNTFYIVGYDRAYINKAIENQLTLHEPEKYADKVFNIEFRIPQTTADVRVERLKEALLNQIEQLYGKSHKVKTKEIDQACKFGDIEKIIRTERDILRFSNNLMLRHLSIREDINFYHLFLLELLSYRNSDMIAAVFHSKTKLIKEHARIMQNQSQSDKIEFNSVLDIEADEISESILYQLFGRVDSNEYFPIYNPDYFNRYFTLTLLPSEFSEKDFNDALLLDAQDMGARLRELYSINPRILADKLLTAYPSKKIEDAATLDKTIRALFILYQDVFPNQKEERLQRNSLNAFMVELVSESKQGPDYLSQRALEMDVTNFTALSFFFSVELIAMYVKEDFNIDPDVYFEAYREAQLLILQKEITYINNGFNSRIPDQIKRLYDFYQAKNTPANKQWFIKRVVAGNNDWYINNSYKILTWIQRSAPTLSGVDTEMLPPIIETLLGDITDPFYNKQEWEPFRLLNAGYVQREYQSGYLTYPQSADIPLKNDKPVDKKFSLKNGEALKVRVKPHETSCWRFGFRLSQSNFFDTSERYVEDYLMLELVKGKINPDEPQNDDPSEGVQFAVKFGKETKKNEVVFQEYNNEAIFVILSKKSEVISFSFQDENGKSIWATDLPGYTGFNHVELSAWADKRAYNMEYGIQTLSTPSN